MINKFLLALNQLQDFAFFPSSVLSVASNPFQVAIA